MTALASLAKLSLRKTGHKFELSLWELQISHRHAVFTSLWLFELRCQRNCGPNYLGPKPGSRPKPKSFETESSAWREKNHGELSPSYTCHEKIIFLSTGTGALKTANDRQSTQGSPWIKYLFEYRIKSLGCLIFYSRILSLFNILFNSFYSNVPLQ